MTSPETAAKEVAYTKAQRQALVLLSSGGVRYGTRIEVMRELKIMSLCYAHDKGPRTRGRWTWRTTEKGRLAIAAIAQPVGKNERQP
jgi:hypothetical protein